MLAHSIANKAIDHYIGGNIEAGEEAIKMAEQNSDSIIDSIRDAIDTFGDGDGIPEVADIFTGIGDLFS